LNRVLDNWSSIKCNVFFQKQHLIILQHHQKYLSDAYHSHLVCPVTCTHNHTTASFHTMQIYCCAKIPEDCAARAQFCNQFHGAVCSGEINPC
jgi:hypothetical protein